MKINMKKRYIVIGTSAAGIGFLNKLVQLDPTADIVCISNEKELPYNKCFLADYLAQRGDRNRIYTKGLDFFNQHNIDLRLNTHVESIDAMNQIVITSEGSFSYDYLFLGLGASPIKPPLNYPAELQGVFSFYNLADVNAIEKYIEEHQVKHVMVVGAGLSGLECADALYQRGYSCTVIDRNSRILASLLNSDAATFLENRIQQYISIKTQQIVVSIEHNNNKVIGALCNDGTLIPIQMIIFALGSRPNTVLAGKAGIHLEHNAVLVNEYLQTSIPTIYAGGDCIVAKNQITGQLTRSCTWPDAMLQGLIAAQNIVGQSRVYPGIVPLVSSNFFDIQFASSGLFCEMDAVTIKQSETEYEAIWHDSDYMRGFQLVGSAKQLPSLKRALLTQDRKF